MELVRKGSLVHRGILVRQGTQGQEGHEGVWDRKVTRETRVRVSREHLAAKENQVIGVPEDLKGNKEKRVTEGCQVNLVHQDSGEREGLLDQLALREIEDKSDHLVCLDQWVCQVPVVKEVKREMMDKEENQDRLSLDHQDVKVIGVNKDPQEFRGKKD